jgi:polysaccharide biosynthesis/export protein
MHYNPGTWISMNIVSKHNILKCIAAAAVAGALSSALLAQAAGASADKPTAGAAKAESVPKAEAGPKPEGGPKAESGPKPEAGPKVESGPKPDAGSKTESGPKPETGPKVEGSKAEPASPSTPEGYRIGAGDVLGISVWKEPDATVAAAVVRSDGKISIPLVKEVPVLGLTPTELERLLTERLSSFIHGADVTVVVKEIHSKKIYFIGAVKKEGPVALVSSMTVLQAIAEAGGLSDYAKPKKIYILRNVDGKQTRLPFDYQAVIRGERIEQNILLLPDDTIIVPH